MTKIAFFDTKPYDKRSFVEENAAFQFDLEFYEPRLTPETAAIARGADVVCAFVNDTINAQTIDVLCNQGIKLLALRCAGYNNIDLPAAQGRLPIVRVPEYSPFAVAEYTLSLILCLNRHLHRAYCRVRENNFSINGFLGFDVCGKTVGVVGTGKIGVTFCKLLQGFNVRILAFDPYINPEAKALGVHYVTLNELYNQSDIISLHCPLTLQNRYLINEESIAHMKRGVMLINTSRGALIQTQALINALKTGHIGSAGLDVYEEETNYFFEDRSDFAIQDDVLARLMTFPNVLVTSHQAFFTREALHNIAQTTLSNIQSFIRDGEQINGICNLCDGKKCKACSKTKR